MMKEALPNFSQTSERDRLLLELGKPQPPVDIVRGVCASLPGDPAWKRRVHSLMQEIVHPDIISWMDDDTGADDNKFVTRALDDFQDRFERFVYHLWAWKVLIVFQTSSGLLVDGTFNISSEDSEITMPACTV